MIRKLRLTLFALYLVLAAAALGAQDWPSFRGPGGRGVADGQDLPVIWNVASGDNVRFKIDLPGVGHSSPVVWGGRIFLTTAETADMLALRLGDEGGIDLAEDDAEFMWKVLAVGAESGEMLWSRDVVRAIPRVHHGPQRSELMPPRRQREVRQRRALSSGPEPASTLPGPGGLV